MSMTRQDANQEAWEEMKNLDGEFFAWLSMFLFLVLLACLDHRENMEKIRIDQIVEKYKDGK